MNVQLNTDLVVGSYYLIQNAFHAHRNDYVPGRYVGSSRMDEDRFPTFEFVHLHSEGYLQTVHRADVKRKLT